MIVRNAFLVNSRPAVFRLLREHTPLKGLKEILPLLGRKMFKAEAEDNCVEIV